jgi:hypothetical protein
MQVTEGVNEQVLLLEARQKYMAASIELNIYRQRVNSGELRFDNTIFHDLAVSSEMAREQFFSLITEDDFKALMRGSTPTR